MKKLLVLFILAAGVLSAQDWNPPFPRTCYFSPGGDYGSSRDYFLAQYDLVVPNGSPALADSVRKRNPNTIIGGNSYQGSWPGTTPPELSAFHATFLELTAEANAGDERIYFENMNGYDFPTKHKYALVGDDDWITYTEIIDDQMVGIPNSGEFALNRKHVIGDSVRFTVRMSGFGMLANMTSFAPTIDGKETWRWLVDYRFERQDFSHFDIVFYDAFRLSLYPDDIERQCGLDLDYNQIDDFVEHNLTWINEQWQYGVEKMLQYEHQRMQELHPGQQASEVLNTGTVQDSYVYDYVDGMLWECFMRFAYNWYQMVDVNLKWEAAQERLGRSNLTLICDYERESRSAGRDQFNRMRYGLTTACISGTYYGRTFGDWCYIGYYHDEFDANLGYPTSEAQEMPSGAWVRFFDNGAAICNPTGQIINVSAAELEGMTGYAGPYYRFRGGQTPEFNNGELFSTVELYGEVRNVDRPRDNQGDGILLFKEPTTLVSDITIGNTYNNDTSPANSPVELVGSWVEVRDRDEKYPTDQLSFSQWSHKPYYEATYHDGIGYAYSAAGDGSSYAVFRPNIGVAGYYKIAEWHGAGSGVATNTPFEIVVDGASRVSGMIDQTTDWGEWITLGYFYLPEGSNSYVKLSNAANGYIIADAVLFRYLGDDPDVDTIPPNPPQNLQLQ